MAQQRPPQLKQGQTVEILTTSPLEVRWLGIGYWTKLNLRGTQGTVRKRSYNNRLIHLRIQHPKRDWVGEVTVWKTDVKLVETRNSDQVSA